MSKLISFHGTDGSGKTTQVELLCKFFESKGANYTKISFLTKEEKKFVYNLLTRLDSFGKTLLFETLHTLKVKETVEAMLKYDFVIVDRWDESYFTHHCNFGDLSTSHHVRNFLHEKIFKGIQPDISFLVSTPVDVCSKRISQRESNNEFDHQSKTYFEKIKYELDILAIERGWNILDGTKCPQEIHSRIITYIG